MSVVLINWLFSFSPSNCLEHLAPAPITFIQSSHPTISIWFKLISTMCVIPSVVIFCRLFLTFSTGRWADPYCSYCAGKLVTGTSGRKQNKTSGMTHSVLCLLSLPPRPISTSSAAFGCDVGCGGPLPLLSLHHSSTRRRRRRRRRRGT